MFNFQANNLLIEHLIKRLEAQRKNCMISEEKFFICCQFAHTEDENRNYEHEINKVHDQRKSMNDHLDKQDEAPLVELLDLQSIIWLV